MQAVALFLTLWIILGYVGHILGVWIEVVIRDRVDQPGTGLIGMVFGVSIAGLISYALVF